MPTIHFQENDIGEAKSVDVPDGGELVDICDDILAPVPFSCRSASCATCQIEVMEGAELLEEPNDEERDLLDVLDAPDNTRLACQTRVKPGSGSIRIKPAGS